MISLLIILYVLAANGFVVPLSCFIVVWIGAIAKAIGVLVQVILKLIKDE